MDPTNKKTAIALGVIALCAGPLIWLLKDVKSPPLGEVASRSPTNAGEPSKLGSNGTRVEAPGSPAAPAAPVPLEVADAPAVASIVVDIREPAKLRQALAQNAWLHQVLDAPLGQGFVGPWAGFWGTKGEDIAASFKGEVVEFAADQLLDAPLRIIWFGDAVPGGPALLAPQPSATASAAFDALSKVAKHGTQTASACPGEVVPDGGAPERAPMLIDRWVLANQALYASKSGGKLALARSPNAVVAALCAKLDPAPAAPGADVQVTLATDGLGHEAQVLSSLLGVGGNPRLSFNLEGDHLVPQGIAGELVHPDRIAVAALSDALLKAVPVDVPVLFTAQLQLPASLDTQTLSAFFADKPTAKTVARQAAVVWIPHGDAKAPTEVAILWSRPADQPELETAFSGPNAMKRATVCGQLVFASTQALLEQIQRTCAGNSPSLANASGAVVAGLRRPASIGLQVSLGALLSGVTLDAWKAEAKESSRSDAVPKEIAAARGQLEALPTFGLTGTANGSTLVGGGFHS